MSRIAYVNGQYVPHNQAAVHIEDRGYQFSDGVYEVIGVLNGALIDEEGHHIRLERSLKELEIAQPMSIRALKVVLSEVVRRNHVREGIVYLQITRGVAPRNHAFPNHNNSAIVVTARKMKLFDPEVSRRGVDVVTVPEVRWKRRDIKTISLLGNCLGKEVAAKAGAYEAWFVEDDGKVTEGTSSNAWIVTADGKLKTRPADNDILNGITRQSIMKVAADNGIEFVEEAFSLEEALSASEAFVSSTTSFVKPVIHIDGHTIGDGKIGKLSEKMFAAFNEYVQAQTQ